MPEDTPRKYKARFYSTTITLRKDATLGYLPPGRAEEGAFNIVDLPFTCTRIISAIVGPSNVDQDSPVTSQSHDGQYLIEIRGDQHNYQNEPICAQAFHGTSNGGYLALPAPIPMAPKATMNVRVSSLIRREDDTKIQVVFHGVEPVVDDPGIPS